MSSCFELLGRSGRARRGRLLTAHGAVETPVFMPVGTLGSVKGVPQETLEELGAEIVLANTYHLYLRPGVDAIRSLGGLHGFMGWDRAILTDSGGYQVFSLSDLRRVSEEGVEFRSHLDGSLHTLTPESATEAQIGLGADVIMAFDECTEYPADRERARQSMEMTLRWAARCKRYFDSRARTYNPDERSEEGALPGPNSSVAKEVPRVARDQKKSDERSEKAALPDPNSSGARGVPRLTRDENKKQLLFGIVQGGMYSDLRRESAERTVEIGFDGYAIGGLSVGESRALTREIVEAALPLLPEDRPRYLMGVGTPDEIVEYASLGVDMMDCVLPTRAARHGLLYTSEGRVAIKNACYARDERPIDPNCGCRVCARYSRAYLRHLYASGELLAQVLNTIHNLAYYLQKMKATRDGIEAGVSLTT